MTLVNKICAEIQRFEEESSFWFRRISHTHFWDKKS